MADLNDIGLTLSDDDEQELNDNLAPPSPFNGDRSGETTIIVAPPLSFHDDPSPISRSNIVPFDTVLFSVAKIYLFKTTNVSSPPPVEKSNSFFSRFVQFFRQSINSSQNAEFNRQCDELLNLTQYPCVMSDAMHLRILYTIYRRLTNSKAIFHTATGPHWEEIGFQNHNPETDFRATGLFSVVCLLYFVDSMYLPLSKQIFQLSRQTNADFPFCCVGINLANFIVKALRRTGSRTTLRKLFEEQQTTKNVSENAAMDFLGKLFIALFLIFSLKWKEKSLTIDRSQELFQELEQTLNHRPKVLLQQFDDYFRRQTQPIDSTSEEKNNENLI